MVDNESLSARLIRRPRVYVSYSGFDAPFAQNLIHQLLRDGRFDVSYDPDSTIDEDNWKDLVYDLVAGCDTIVTVLSPDAIETCEWELECAVEQSKRIIPVVCRDLEGKRLPSPLHALKAVDCRSEERRTAGIAELIGKLSTDLDWLREHTRLLSRARDWDKAGRPNHLLMNKAEIEAAKMWTFDRPQGAGKPNELHLTYISTSEAVTTARHGAVAAYQAQQEEMEAVAHLSAAANGIGRWWKQAAVMVLFLAVVLAALSDRYATNASFTQQHDGLLSEQSPSGALPKTDKAGTEAKTLATKDKQSDWLGLRSIWNSVLWKFDYWFGDLSGDSDVVGRQPVEHGTTFDEPPEK